MKKEWISQALELCKTPADFYSGSRKILRNIYLEFPFECTLQMGDIGYTKMKYKQLERNYWWQESIDMAVQLWDRYRERPKYRSVSFSCYRSLVKDSHGPRGSVMGPCLQSVVITMADKGKECDVQVLYRTTEFMKKFPADLVFLRDRLLTNFNFNGMKVNHVGFYFVNVTIHPAYFVILIPHLTDPIRELNLIKEADPYFYNWVIKWSSRYLIEKYSHGIAKFSQALQIQKYARSRITDDKYNQITEYLEANHPGYTRSRFTEEGEDDVD